MKEVGRAYKIQTPGNYPEESIQAHINSYIEQIQCTMTGTNLHRLYMSLYNSNNCFPHILQAQWHLSCSIMNFWNPMTIQVSPSNILMLFAHHQFWPSRCAFSAGNMKYIWYKKSTEMITEREGISLYKERTEKLICWPNVSLQVAYTEKWFCNHKMTIYFNESHTEPCIHTLWPQAIFAVA
jgi:hypothetical protein